MFPCQSMPSLVAGAALLVLCPTVAFAQAPDDLVKRRKADLLYPLGPLIQSSRGADGGEFIIGVLGKDPFDGADRFGRPVNHLDAMARESNAARDKTGRKHIVIKRFDDAKQYTRCDLLFVAADQLQAALALAERQKAVAPVLLVADTEGFARRGVPVNFYLEAAADGSIHVRLECNPDAAARTGFDRIDPQLFRLLQRGLGRIVR